MSLAGYREQQAVELASRFKERLQGISGVESVAHARMIPLQGSGFGLGSVRVPGVTGPREDGRFDADWDVVSPEYFETIEMPIVEGRAFRDSDRDGAPLGRDRQRDVRPAGVAGTVRRRPDVHAANGREGRAHRRDRRRGARREVPLHQQRHRRRSSTCRWRSSRAGDIEFYVRHAPGRQVGQEIRAAMAQVEPNVPIVDAAVVRRCGGASGCCRRSSPRGSRAASARSASSSPRSACMG